MMKKRGVVLCCAAIAVVGGCAGQHSKLEIRAKNSPLAEGDRPVSFRVAEARGQLLIGNVALALESFRKAEREDPTSIDALAGIAECYERMGRGDLSQRYYEAALAVAPTNTALLQSLALMFERNGRTDDAAAIRSEIASRAATAEAETKSEQPAVADHAQIEPEVLLATPVAAETPAPAVAIVAVGQNPATPDSGSTRVGGLAAARAVARELAANPSEVGRSVTVALPPARPVSAPAPAVALPPQRKKPAGHPRLERMSLGEVALVTQGGPRWKSEAVAQNSGSTKIRFIPLQPSAEPPEIRLLNAARVHRLAARTRKYLSGNGWRSILIGDAEATREQSVIYYPSGQRSVAIQLSKQIGFSIAPNGQVQQVTVLLGRDSLRIAGGQARS